MTFSFINSIKKLFKNVPKKQRKKCTHSPLPAIRLHSARRSLPDEKYCRAPSNVVKNSIKVSKIRKKVRRKK